MHDLRHCSPSRTDSSLRSVTSEPDLTLSLCGNQRGRCPLAAFTKHRGGGLPALRVTHPVRLRVFVPQSDLLPKSMVSFYHTNFCSSPHKILNRLFVPTQSTPVVCSTPRVYFLTVRVSSLHTHYGSHIFCSITTV